MLCFFNMRLFSPCSFCISWLPPQYCMISIITTVRTKNFFNFSSNLHRLEQSLLFLRECLISCQQCYFVYCFNCLSNAITCRIWLSLGLCCFLLEWKIPFLEGNPRRRFPKQKPTSYPQFKDSNLEEVLGLFPDHYAHSPYPWHMAWVFVWFSTNLTWITRNLCIHIVLLLKFRVPISFCLAKLMLKGLKVWHLKLLLYYIRFDFSTLAH